MIFSVVTPSFNNSEYLKSCLASVADQGVTVQHIVQDGGSNDGTLDWLLGDRRVEAHVESDRGMYDAINRGFKRATGEILAHLNCDEQYLPGALQAVRDYFASHPTIDILFGDTVVVDLNGNYLFHRKTQVPLKWHTRLCPLSTLTCTTFYRRSIIEKHNLFFDDSYKYIGDSDWMNRALNANLEMAILRRFTSIFAHTGSNLSLEAAAVEERIARLREEPAWLKTLRPAVLLFHRMRRLYGGVYAQKPFSYSIYKLKNPKRRLTHHAAKPTARWKW